MITGNYQIYHKEYGFCNYFKINLLTPILIKGTVLNNWEEKDKALIFEANTEISYFHSMNHWTFSISFFGFGVQLYRQWNY